MTLDIENTERLVIAAAMKFGSSVVNFMVHNGLTPDKFSVDYAPLWRNIVKAVLEDGVEPSIYISQDSQELARYEQLKEGLESAGIYTLEQLNLEAMGERIFTAGSLRLAAGPIWKAGAELENLDALVNRVGNASTFLGELASDLYDADEQLQTGYIPIKQVADSVREELQRMREGRSSRILGCGWPSLRMRNLFPLGKMAVIHGEPSAGKTQFALQTLLGSAIQLVAHGVKGCVVFNSLEMDLNSLGIRLACLVAGVDFTVLENNTGPKDSYQHLDKALDFVEGLPIHLSDDPSLTTDMMSFQLGVLQLAQGPVWQVVTDYGQLFADKADNEERRVGSIFREQKRIAAKLNFSLLALSQDTSDKTDQYRIATPRNLRWSGEIEQAADVIALVWNPVVLKQKGEKFRVRDGLSGDRAWLLVQKYRNGKVGEFPLDFDIQYGRFSDPALKATMMNQTDKLYENLIWDGDKWEIN